MNEDDRYARGLRVRRAVLGAAHVKRATLSATGFDREFQRLLTRFVWGEIWTRPGLPRKTRRLVTIAILVALGRADELHLHLRAALAGGVSRDEVKELLLQTAVYCGVPAARAAFEAAKELLADRGSVAAGRRAKRRRAKPARGRRVVGKSRG